MKQTDDQIGETAFDREYRIEDLLPISILEELSEHIQKIAPIEFMVLNSEGSPFPRKETLIPDAEASICLMIREESIDHPRAITLSKCRYQIFPIFHELEIVGYLILWVEVNDAIKSFPMRPLGALILSVLHQIIRFKYKTLLTGQLHGQVVEESYAQLKRKAALLEKSERKYRLLAENLEKEVEKKTRKIKETQAQLLQHDKLTSIGQLAAGVAHEINNPIGFVQSNLGTLNEYGHDLMDLLNHYLDLEAQLIGNIPAKQSLDLQSKLETIGKQKKEIDLDFIIEDYTKVINDSLEGTGRVSKIVSDLKDFVHLDKADLQYADVNEGVESTLNIISNELKDKVEIVKSLGTIPKVPCYPQQMNQVFLNILMNAAQSIREKGTVHIVTTCSRTFIEINISDSGCGIPSGVLPKIFDPFFTTKDVGRGTGLGLNMAYNIIKAHGGTIAVESEVGKGTTFRIRLPVKGVIENEKSQPSTLSIDK